MKRTLAGGTALVLAILLAGCGDDEEPTDGGPTTSAGADSSGDSFGADSSAASGEGDSGGDSGGDSEEEGDPETETFARGADVADFCAAMAEIDTAIDEAQVGSDEDWERIVASFDALEDLGVPDDLPTSGIAEITEVDLLVRQSDSVAELNAATEDYRPKSRTVDDYLDDNCD